MLVTKTPHLADHMSFNRVGCALIFTHGDVRNSSGVASDSGGLPRSRNEPEHSKGHIMVVEIRHRITESEHRCCPYEQSFRFDKSPGPPDQF